MFRAIEFVLAVATFVAAVPPQAPEPPQAPPLSQAVCLCSIGGPCRCEAIGRECDCPGVAAKTVAPKIVIPPATVRVRVESAPLLGPGWHRH